MFRSGGGWGEKRGEWESGGKREVRREGGKDIDSGLGRERVCKRAKGFTCFSPLLSLNVSLPAIALAAS